MKKPMIGLLFAFLTLGQEGNTCTTGLQKCPSKSAQPPSADNKSQKSPSKASTEDPPQHHSEENLGLDIKINNFLHEITKSQILKNHFPDSIPLMKDLVQGEEGGAYMSCHKAANDAQFYCVDLKDFDTQKWVSWANGVVNVGAGAMSLLSSCNSMGTIAGAAGDMLSAWKATCGLVQANCDTDCGKAASDIKNLQETLKKEGEAFGKIANPEQLPQQQELIDAWYIYDIHLEVLNKSLGDEMDLKGKEEKKLKSIALKQLRCKDYQEDLMQAGLFLANVLPQIIASSKNCKDKTNGNFASNTEEANQRKKKGDKGAQEEVNCSLPKYQSYPLCLCQAAPKTPGCADVLAQAETPGANLASLKIQGPNGLNNMPSLDLGGASQHGAGNSAGFRAQGADGGVLVGDPGKANSGLSGGGGSSSDSLNKSKDQKSRFNTKVLMDAEGGGGGGGGYRRTASAPEDDDFRKNYGPGSAHAEKMAAANEWKNQVGSAYGLGLFKKNRDALIREWPTLRHPGEK